MFPYVFSAFVISILVIDLIFLKQAKSVAYRSLIVILLICAFFAIYQKPLFWLTNLLGVWRPVDAIMYFAVVILVREVFLSRARRIEDREEFTQLVRSLAISKAQFLSADQEKING